MSEVMSLPKAMLRSLRTACLLHDVGQLGLRDEVLHKADVLTRDELKHVQQHVTLGKKLLSSQLFDDLICTFVHYHHERYDGSGYPEGLKADQIPLGARILAVAEAFTAMTEDRPYQKAVTEQQAVEEIMSLSGSQFCPHAAGALAAAFDAMSAEATDQEGDSQSSADEADGGEKRALSLKPPGSAKADMRRRIQQVADLKPLPSVVSEILTMKPEDEVKVEDLANKIKFDPGLVTKLLRVSNSVLYRGRSAIDSMEQAVVRLGFERVREMVIALAAVEQWQDAEGGRTLSMEAFWRHSVATALIGQQIAKACRITGPDTIFTAGLIHDVGALVLQEASPAKYNGLGDEIQAKKISISQAEETAFGIDHAEVMREVGQGWNMPHLLLRLIAAHHKPWFELRSVDADNLRQIICLRVSNLLANACCGGKWPGGTLERIPGVQMALLGLDEKILAPMLADLPQQVQTLAEAYGIALDDEPEENEAALGDLPCGYYVLEQTSGFDPLQYVPEVYNDRVVKSSSLAEWFDADESAWCCVNVCSSAFAEQLLQEFSSHQSEERLQGKLLVLLPQNLSRRIRQEFSRLGIEFFSEPCSAMMLREKLKAISGIQGSLTQAGTFHSD